MAKRKAIPKSIRFEVFKRDSFTCQYCGATAPACVLVIDHILPVAKGGDADILNLITSCDSCNSGKSDRLLSDNTVVAKQKQQLDELNERRQQLEMLMEWKMALSDKSYEIDKVVEFFNKLCQSSITLTEVGEKELKALIKKYGMEKVITAVEESADKYHYLTIEERWSKIRTVVKYIGATDEEKQKAYILGIVRNKYGANRLTDASYLLDLAIERGLDLESWIESTKRLEYWSWWRDNLQEYIKTHESEDF